MTFAAAHRYRRPDWSDARNAAVFGPCARPSYHGHGYTCHVTVRGAVDAETGFCVDLALLDRVLQEEVRERFDHRNLNVDVPEFADGALIPTGENLARYVAERVQARLDAAGGGPAGGGPVGGGPVGGGPVGGGPVGGGPVGGGPVVTRVVVAEDETLSVTYEPGRDA